MDAKEIMKNLIVGSLIVSLITAVLAIAVVIYSNPVILIILFGIPLVFFIVGYTVNKFTGIGDKL